MRHRRTAPATVTGDDAATSHWETGKAPLGRTGSQDTSLRRHFGMEDRACALPSSRVTWGDDEPTICLDSARCRAHRLRRRRPRYRVRDDHRRRSRIVGCSRSRPRARRSAVRHACSIPTTIRRRRRSPTRIATTVGAQTRSLGGLGAYESVSIRGAAPGHTEVLDRRRAARAARRRSRPISAGSRSTSFGEVDLYRGAVPVELGGAGVGGALNLVTRLGRGERGERVQRRSARARSARAICARTTATTTPAARCCRRRRSVIRARPATTRTSTTTARRSTPATMAFATRRNNGFDQVDAASRTRHERWLGGRRRARRVEAAGPAGQRRRTPTMTARDVDLDAIGDGRVDVDRRARDRAPARLRARRDPAPARSRGRARPRHAGPRVSHAVGRRVDDVVAPPIGITARGLELRADRFRDDRRDGIAARARRHARRRCAARRGATSRSRAAHASRRRCVSTSLRTAPTALTVGPMAFDAGAARAGMSCRARGSTARLAVTSDVVAQGAAPAGTCGCRRCVELFGDRGYHPRRARPAPGARARPAISAACGRRRRAIGAVRSDLRRGRRVRDARARHDRVHHDAPATSRARRTSAHTETYGARARRVGARRAHARRSPRATRASHRAALRAIVSVDGKPSCRARPAHSLYARADVVAHVADRVARVARRRACSRRAFLDPANLGRVPARTLVGAGATRRARRRRRRRARGREPRRHAHRRAAARHRRRAPRSPRRRPRSPTSPDFRCPAAASICRSIGITRKARMKIRRARCTRSRRLRRQPPWHPRDVR